MTRTWMCFILYTLKQATGATQMSQKVKTIQSLISHIGVTFASINYTTPVKTAAKHQVTITKTTQANVQLFGKIKDFTSVYANAVKRKTGETDFVAQQNYFKHTDCYSLVQHNTQPDKFYLYAIFNNAKSEYLIDGLPATKNEVAFYLTPSAAKALLNPVVASTDGLEHDVNVRTISIDNINSITANKQTVVL
jgi:hypothetical protein